MADLVISHLQTRVPGLSVFKLEALNCCLSGSEITGFQGPSGSGKSLLLRAIADLDPSVGDVRLGDVDRDSIEAHSWRAKVAYLPADSGWWFDTVGEHFALLDEDMLQKLGFDSDVLVWKISRISSGEKQRLALIRCLSLSPQALLLDEPTASLGQSHSRDVEILVKNYSQDNRAPVLWVSHDNDQLNRISTRSLSIQADGKILESVL